MYKQTIEEKIRQRRSQMLIHSHIYYEMDDNIVDDHTWQAWADELAQLQDENPDKCKIGFFDEHFEGWNGSSGAFLPLRDPWVINKATYIMGLQNR